MSPDVGDVVARARGLAGHLLGHPALERLARASGSAALGRSLRAIGYGPVPADRPVSRSTVEAIDAAIEHESGRRLALLGRWLAERRVFFAGIFEEGERRAIRIRLRRLVAGGGVSSDRGRVEGEFPMSRRAREALERAADLPDLLRALRAIGSPYEAPLRSALRSHGDDLLRLEMALDRAFAERARAAARRFGGRLLSWVREGIDVDNAWSAVAGQADAFIEGGAQLSRARHAAISGQADGRQRRLELDRVFGRGPLSGVFGTPDTPLAHLERRALHARIAHERRVGRIDPIGPSPILECVMRMRAECVDLRGINWGVAAGLPTATIVGQLAVTT